MPFRLATFSPLFAVLFLVAGIGMSIYAYQKALGYQQAYARYQQRRAAVDRPERHDRQPGAEG